MTLLVFNINGKTAREKERLKTSVNWDETSAINNLRILVEILFGPIAFEELRDNIIFLTSISSVGLRKKEFILTEGRKLWKLFFEYLIEDWMSVATFTKYLLKALAISCGSVKLRPLSKMLDGAIGWAILLKILDSLYLYVLFRLFWKYFAK